MTPIQKEVFFILKKFQEHKVRYLVAGGFAVNYYGYSRMTVDMDLWIDRTDENFRKIIKAVDAAGYDIKDLEKIEIKDLLPVDIPVEGIRIELLPELSGLPDFDAACRNASWLDIDGIRIPVLSKEDLIQSKKGSFRRKDQDDIEYLEGPG